VSPILPFHVEFCAFALAKCHKKHLLMWFLSSKKVDQYRNILHLVTKWSYLNISFAFFLFKKKWKVDPIRGIECNKCVSKRKFLIILSGKILISDHPLLIICGKTDHILTILLKMTKGIDHTCTYIYIIDCRN